MWLYRKTVKKFLEKYSQMFNYFFQETVSDAAICNYKKFLWLYFYEEPLHHILFWKISECLLQIFQIVEAAFARIILKERRLTDLVVRVTNSYSSLSVKIVVLSPVPTRIPTFYCSQNTYLIILIVV